jgi:hypothetical protein
MCELEALIQQLLELANANPDLLFKIVPNKDRTNWDVEFIKGGVWWGVKSDSLDETLIDVLKAALGYFPQVTDEVIQDYKDNLIGV